MQLVKKYDIIYPTERKTRNYIGYRQAQYSNRAITAVMDNRTSYIYNCIATQTKENSTSLTGFLLCTILSVLYIKRLKRNTERPRY